MPHTVFVDIYLPVYMARHELIDFKDVLDKGIKKYVPNQEDPNNSGKYINLKSKRPYPVKTAPIEVSGVLSLKKRSSNFLTTIVISQMKISLKRGSLLDCNNLKLCIKICVI